MTLARWYRLDGEAECPWCEGRSGDGKGAARMRYPGVRVMTVDRQGAERDIGLLLIDANVVAVRQGDYTTDYLRRLNERRWRRDPA